MSDSFAKSIFPKQYSKIEKARQSVMNRPLCMKEINTLMSLRFGGIPAFDSIAHFFSDEYKKGLEQNLPSAELEKLEKFRPATASEANILFNDLHMREEKEEYTGTGVQSD